jgi:hypothetical protein
VEERWGWGGGGGEGVDAGCAVGWVDLVHIYLLGMYKALGFFEDLGWKVCWYLPASS